MGTGVGPAMGMGHSVRERPGHGHGDHRRHTLDEEALGSLPRDAQGGYSRTHPVQGSTGRMDAQGHTLHRDAQGECPRSCSTKGCAGGIPRDTSCTGKHRRDSQRDTACTRMPRAVQGHIVHRDAQGELSRAVPRGGTCYWLRLKASRKGGDQPPMGKASPFWVPPLTGNPHKKANGDV